jgi:hypothetical protein
MDVPFPFGYPAATRFYLTLYVATLVIHVVFMNYVLAGTAYLAAFAIRRHADAAEEQADPLASPLRDWMPFMLSAAITAGIAPLLFVQILYQRQFYTANLLLFHRWMAILPVLIVGFYLLYLLKSRVLAKATFAWRIAVGCGAFACFAFTAWSWTENHLLSLNESVWPAQYESKQWFYRNAELFPRLAVWFTGAFPTMVTIASWQLLSTGKLAGEAARPTIDRCARLALGGLGAATAATVWYLVALESDVRNLLVAPAARWYLLLALSGLAVQAAAWISARKEPALTAKRLSTISAGLLLTIVGTSVLREIRRLTAIDGARLAEFHADAASVGGLWAFLAFAALNAVLIGWCLAIVRKSLPGKPGV